jgi:hypothetical protein
MYSTDSSDLTLPASGSRLLSESPLPSAPHTGHGGNDLSLSELSLSDRTEIFQKPFSLLARPEPEPSTPTRKLGDDGCDNADGQDEGNERDEDMERSKRHAAKLREEKLKSDIFILKKLNASFATFNEALENTGSANDVSSSAAILWLKMKYFI